MFVRANPELVGAGNDWQTFLEYPLPSLDEIDVVFKSAYALIGVEVKSRISDSFPSDYERGLFQTVKYRALLEAMARSANYGIPAEIKIILVLETRLPAEFRELANRLGVSVLENVKPM